MDQTQQQQKVMEIMLPIELQISKCVTDDERLAVACVMLQRASDIFDQVLGEQGRKTMFGSMA